MLHCLVEVRCHLGCEGWVVQNLGTHVVGAFAVISRRQLDSPRRKALYRPDPTERCQTFSISGKSYAAHVTANNPTKSSPLDAQLCARYQDFVDSRPPGADEDVHMIPAIVDHVIERCSPKGGLVFDPFAGFGTTLNRAVHLGRQAIGIELLPERVAHIEQHVPQARIIEGDARELLHLVQNIIEPSSVDLILTSPPYMTVNDHQTDPLTAYELDGGDYSRYLDELGEIALQCAYLLRPGGFLVWNVADIKHREHVTHLIHDSAKSLTTHLTHIGTTNIVWDALPHDLVADALLVFQH